MQDHEPQSRGTHFPRVGTKLHHQTDKLIYGIIHDLVQGCLGPWCRSCHAHRCGRCKKVPAGVKYVKVIDLDENEMSEGYGYANCDCAGCVLEGSGAACMDYMPV